MLSFHDLTAHQQAQAAIVEAEREKHANDAKSKFLGIFFFPPLAL
jgi:hypothetical protein